MASQFEQRVRADINDAMRHAHKERTGVLRMLLSELKNREIELQAKTPGYELTDEDSVGVVSRAVKQRKDSVAQYRAGGREDLAVKEESEIAVLQQYLPAPLTAADVRAMVREFVTAGADNMGAVMKQLSPRIKGRFDGAEANRIVREVLGA
ncbi:MAG TPA: GatB/YqeY domain-containing protein [Longimicrobiales bacterium]|nr:GatB/YqeY domain-containing protein [Longimicrobiales bacterium]